MTPLVNIGGNFRDRTSLSGAASLIKNIKCRLNDQDKYDIIMGT